MRVSAPHAVRVHAGGASRSPTPQRAPPRARPYAALARLRAHGVRTLQTAMLLAWQVPNCGSVVTGTGAIKQNVAVCLHRASEVWSRVMTGAPTRLSVAGRRQACVTHAWGARQTCLDCGAKTRPLGWRHMPPEAGATSTATKRIVSILHPGCTGPLPCCGSPAACLCECQLRDAGPSCPRSISPPGGIQSS